MARGTNGVLVAVRAGLGIAVFRTVTAAVGQRGVAASTGLPALPALDLVLLANPRAPERPVAALTSLIVSGGVVLKPKPAS